MEGARQRHSARRHISRKPIAPPYPNTNTNSFSAENPGVEIRSAPVAGVRGEVRGQLREARPGECLQEEGDDIGPL